MWQKAKLSDEEKRQQIEKLYAQSKTHFPEVEEVTVEELDRLREKEDVVLVDVRKPEEREVSTIPGAIAADDVLARPEDFAGRTLVTYCTVGHRSGLFAQEQRTRGQRVVNLKGSILAWTHARRDLDHDGEPTKRVHVAGPRWSLEASGYEPVW